MIWRTVASMRVKPAWPLLARVAVSSATSETDFIAFTSSLPVAEISFAVAPISVVVEKISFAVACCCLAVAAISVLEVVTWMPDFCT